MDEEDLPLNCVVVLGFNTEDERVVLIDNKEDDICIVVVYTRGDDNNDDLNEDNWDDVDDKEFVLTDAVELMVVVF